MRTFGAIIDSAPIEHSSPIAAPASMRAWARMSQLRPTIAPLTTAPPPT